MSGNCHFLVIESKKNVTNNIEMQIMAKQVMAVRLKEPLQPDFKFFEVKFARLTNDLTIANVLSANNCWCTDSNLKKPGKNRHQPCSGRPMEELG